MREREREREELNAYRGCCCIYFAGWQGRKDRLAERTCITEFDAREETSITKSSGPFDDSTVPCDIRSVLE